MIAEINKSDIGATVLQLLSELMPTIQAMAMQSSAIGTYQRTLNALHLVHSKPKVILLIFHWSVLYVLILLILNTSLV